MWKRRKHPAEVYLAQAREAARELDQYLNSTQVYSDIIRDALEDSLLKDLIDEAHEQAVASSNGSHARSGESQSRSDGGGSTEGG